MASKPYREQLQEASLAALRGLHAAVGTGGRDAVVLAAVLERVGDLQRLGERLPTWCVEWLAAASELELGAVLAVYQEEVAGWPVPEGRVDLQALALLGDESPGPENLTFVLQRRDELASALAAITRVSVHRGRAPMHIPGLVALLATVRAWEDALGHVLDRWTGERLLGDRVAIAAPSGWTARLPESAAEHITSSDITAMVVGLDGVGEPDDAAVHAYLQSGALLKYVEGCAARSPDFAENLATTIETLRDLRELGDAIAPRRWLKVYRGATATPTVYPVRRLRLAAADVALAAVPQEFDLGAIPGLETDVNATLEVTAAEVILTIDADQRLVEVSIGDTVARSPREDGSWQARCARPAGSFTFRIESINGGVFSDELIFVSEPE